MISKMHAESAKQIKDYCTLQQSLGEKLQYISVPLLSFNLLVPRCSKIFNYLMPYPQNLTQESWSSNITPKTHPTPTYCNDHFLLIIFVNSLPRFTAIDSLFCTVQVFMIIKTIVDRI